MVKCPTCLGTGWSGHLYECWSCDGKGKVKKSRTITIKDINNMSIIKFKEGQEEI